MRHVRQLLFIIAGDLQLSLLRVRCLGSVFLCCSELEIWLIASNTVAKALTHVLF